MSVDFHQIPHKGIQTLTPYKPGKPIVEVMQEFGLTDIIKLASNENPLGCSPEVVKVLQGISDSTIAYYPSAQNHPLYQQLATKLGVNTEQLIITNGSDSIFLFLLMAFTLHTGKSLLTHDHAFSNYQIQAQSLGTPAISTSLHDDWRVNIDEMIAACTEKTGLICIANPNNPTGILIADNEIKRLLENVPESTIVVLDEAYYEYAKARYSTNSIPFLSEHKNLVITRTFSKAYGLAGLRLGYAIANPDIIALLKKLQLPFAVNQVALDAGVAALNDEHFLQQTLSVNEMGMQQMLEGLEGLGVSVLPMPAANFVTMKCQKDGMEIFNKLLENGIIVRPLHPYNMPMHLRVTIGTAQQNARFLNALSTILES